MKRIVAYIKPHRLSEVTLGLHGIQGLTGATVSDVRGFGRCVVQEAPDRIHDHLVDFTPRVRIEIVCLDELAEAVVSMIEQKAHTGLRGDGKIYVSDVEAAIRISTGERGHEAC